MSNTSVDVEQPTVTISPPASRSRKARMNRPVFFGSAAMILAVAIWTMVAPASAEQVIGMLSAWTIENLGWFYVSLAVGCLLFLLWLALSRYGQVRLGPKYSKPAYGTFTWAAMIFAAGINIDLMFFAVSGPVSHFLYPPGGESGSEAAARESSVWTIFHYGINGWAIYAVMGLALAYFAYRRNLPLAIRSVLYPIIGKRIRGVMGHGIDIAAILGTIFGVAASLGIGVVQLNFGLQAIFGVPEHVAVQIALLSFGLLVSTLSAVSGVDRGIKWLSQLNVVLAALLAVFVLFVGDTLYLLNGLIANTGDYFTSLLGRSAETFAFNPQNEWMGDWTLFFWAWWIAYAAFIGLFLARISRGRTIRQFVGGVLILPFMYIVMWVSIFGNAAVGLIRDGNSTFGEIAASFPEQGFYALLAEYPAFTVVALIATFTGLLFFVTTADSGALVMGQISSYTTDPHQTSTNGVRIFWGAAMALLTAVMMIAGGIAVMQSATIVIALPFSFILVLVMIGLVKSLRDEFAAGTREGRKVSRFAAAARVRGLAFKVHGEGTEDHLKEVAVPVIQDLAVELADRGLEATIDVEDASDQPYRIGLTVNSSSESVFHASLATTGAGRVDTADAGLDLHVNGVRSLRNVESMAHAQLIDHIFDEFERWSELADLDEAPYWSK